MTFSITIPKKLEVTQTARPNIANYIIENPEDKDIFVTQLEIIPNFKFAEKGKLAIRINGINQFLTEDSGYFSDLTLFNVPLDNNSLQRYKTIEVFAWNDIDSETLAVTINATLSDENTAPQNSSSPISRTDKNRGTTDQGTITTADGGSGITRTVYTCPANMKAKVLKFESRVKNSGSASVIHLKLRNQRLKTWKPDGHSPNAYDNNTSSIARQFPLAMSIEARKIWSDGSYPEFNKTFDDLQDEELSEGETIAFDGDFSSNFNATIDFSYTILETRAI